MRFTDEELERYGRQIVLPEIGGFGQEQLRAASVMLVGAGGLGAPVALYLVAAGIGRLVLVDDDDVALGNLQRQVLYAADDVGTAKVETARRRLGALNPLVQIDALRERVTPANAQALAASVDLVLDGTDSFATRAAVAAASAAAHRPLISGSVQGFEGQLTTFAPSLRAGTPCFRCLFADEPAGDALPTCALGGILGPVAGQVGAMMAGEAIKWILGFDDDLVGRLLLIDGRAATIDHISVRRRAHCDGGCAPADSAASTATLAPHPS